MRRLVYILFCLLWIAPDEALAVNFYDGARAQGTYFLSYASVYTAEETTDKSGHTGKNDYGYFNVQELLRLCYYRNDFVVTALVPFGETDIHSLGQNASGFGDINLGAGYFLPFKQIDILPMIFVEFPTSTYNSSKAANIGSNQYDIKPMIFLYKAFGDFSIDEIGRAHV